MTDRANPIDAVRARLDGGRGWMKGDFNDGRGRFCLVGACNQDTTIILIREVAREMYPDRTGPYLGAAQFNDHEDTIWPDIEAVLDKAALRYDETVR
jgi:hypothetical protein